MTEIKLSMKRARELIDDLYCEATESDWKCLGVLTEILEQLEPPVASPGPWTLRDDLRLMDTDDVTVCVMCDRGRDTAENAKILKRAWGLHRWAVSYLAKYEGYPRNAVLRLGDLRDVMGE